MIDRVTQRFTVLAEARAELGNHNPNAYWIDVWKYGKPYPPHWCGAFALAMLHRADVALNINWTFAPPRYGFLYHLFGHETKQPGPGDIAYFDAPYQHHAVVVRSDGDTLWTIDGNTTLSRTDPLPPRILEKERLWKSTKVVCYSIDKWLSHD